MSLRLSNSYFLTRTGGNPAGFNDRVKLLHLWSVPAAQFCARVSSPSRDVTTQSANVLQTPGKGSPVCPVQLGEEEAGEQVLRVPFNAR